MIVKLLRKPEAITLLLLLIAFGIAAITPSVRSYFLDTAFLLDSTSLYMEIGVMALAMTFVIISGNIDLSVASGLALIAVCSAKLYNNLHIPMPAVMVIALLMGALLGLFNGLLIAKLRLPSLTVTLGTLALYRGLAQYQLGDKSLGNFPDWFNGLDYRHAGLVPYPLIIFLVLAVIFGLVLHKTVFGRCVYAIGTNEPAARFSGLQVDRVKIVVYMISGMMSAVGALMILSRLTIARYDLAPGNELAVITAVVLGGADIFGGRGSIIGTVLALFLLAIVQQAMNLKPISAENQLAVTGSLLVLSVILANLTGKLGTRVRSKRPAAPSPGGDTVHA